MKSFGKKSSAYICYLIVNFWWYMGCVVGSIFPPLLAYEYFEGTHPDSILGITVPLNTSLITWKNPEQYQHIAIGSVSGQIDFDYILQHSPGTFISWAIFVCLVLALFLFGIYQLRTLLKATVDDAIFTKQNIRRIKTLAVIIMLIDPLRWIQHHFIFETLGTIIAPETTGISIELPMVGQDWTFIIMGLLVFTLAAIFEKGHKMYQELKLTV